MPTYEYRCQTCGIQFDVQQSIADDSLSLCPEAASPYSPSNCVDPGKGKVSKVFFALSITFKGSGFYKTDSRSSARQASSGGNSDASGVTNSAKEQSQTTKERAGESSKERAGGNSNQKKPAESSKGPAKSSKGQEKAAASPN